ncbi:ufm1-specific protease 2 [Anthonomus grandis grandis]|uniref:ufm1-specific protease 2 n=1 Tax=Anthonomus grandis grandis TaxID=2921223 RepID=UPI002165009C|nr:ufm1-specific protease 2 [Anthonomus grandis grandis]
MKPQIYILDTILQRFKKLNDPCNGKLFGIFVKNTLHVLGLQMENGLNLIHSFPAEIDFCGTFEAYPNPSYDSQQVLSRSSQVEVTDNPIFISILLTIQNEISCNIVCNNQITNVSYTILTLPEIYSSFMHVRLQGEFLLHSEQNEQSIADSFTELRKSIASGVMAFTIPKLNILLVTSDSESGIIGLTGDPAFGEICQEANCEGPERKKKNDQTLKLDAVDISLIKRATRDGFIIEPKSHSPVVILDKKKLELINIPLKLNFLAMISKHTKLSKLYDILLESAIKNLRLYESVLQNYLKTHKISTGIELPETMHFFPKEAGHFLTRIVIGNSEKEDKEERELLHEALLLPKTTPVFRKANQFEFSDCKKPSGPLRNVHEGLPLPLSGEACKVSLVKGEYEYYHYGQNKMDDKGWGCAYRSLQTLASWFKLQGYTSRPVPTFKEIQKCLVDIGDKPANFIDSTQWIGSSEVNFVLKSLLGVTSKILYVNSGEELGTKGPELLQHFEMHGSPVMIGGGVLAHTILGVEYNQLTGSLKFLILDPHYTGEDDLNVILNRKWCAWKGVDFFNKSAYYNMCLPQVPREF